MWGHYKNRRLKKTCWAAEASVPFWSQREGRLWFETSKGRREIHVEREKHTFGK